MRRCECFVHIANPTITWSLFVATLRRIGTDAVTTGERGNAWNVAKSFGLLRNTCPTIKYKKVGDVKGIKEVE